MNKKQASELIQTTFPEAFDKSRFRTFALNVLNHLDESKAQQWSTQYVKDAFKDHVHRYERLGTYTSPEKEKVDVLVVYLTTESKLERARTAIRNFVADHLKARDEKDAALVAFVSPTETQWRLSYVKMEYATVEKESGKVGVETRLTPARRFSYMVGEGESCHTAQTRFLDLLQDTSTDPTLAQIEEAFSVEAVTKEFFGKYAELFGDINAALEKMVGKDKTLRDEFTAKGVNTVDFAKKLMGQIVFLYFLQKKGWLGVEKGKDWGTGPRDFLRRMANGAYGKYDNFFNDILEPLFYDTLATDRGHEAWCSRFKCRIPFLNGGLFEPLWDYDWKKTDILIPNKLFTNNEFVEEGITGTGVLDVFDRYNFTVNEAEPLEKEVAIDPEMLGKVFENLIEENRRKGLGAFYTPREIVHYMCQEVLINYLDTAVTGMRADIETFVRLGEQISHYEAVDAKYAVKMPKNIEKNAKGLDDALKSITVCDPAVGSGAFPVGMMTEIVRARCALTPYFNDVAERTAYHFKRHAIQNCLYGVDIDSSAVEIAKLRLWLSLVVDEEDVKQVKPLPNLDYKIVVGNSLLAVEKDLFNNEAFKRLEALKPRYFDEFDHVHKAKLRKQIESVIHELTHGKEAFDFEIFFSEVFHQKGGFDVVIGNPPYGMVTDEAAKAYYEAQYVSAEGRFDTFELFLERAVKLDKPSGGKMMFIIPSPVLTNVYSRKLRRFLLEETSLSEITSFGLEVFDEPTVHSSIIGSSRPSRGNNLVAIRKQVNNLGELKGKCDYSVAQSELAQGEHSSFDIFLSPELRGLVNKLSKESLPLADVCHIRQCIKTGDDDRYVKHSQTRPGADWKPSLRGRSIERYCIREDDLWIKYGNWLARNWQNKTFYEVEKLAVRETGSRIIATLDADKRYFLSSLYSVYPIKNSLGPSLKYLLGIINSNLATWFVHLIAFGLTEGAFTKIRTNQFGRLPIRIIRMAKSGEKLQHDNIVRLVDRILAAKRRNADADTSALEREIDQSVYQLYSLTPTEIEIVEGAAS